MKKEAKEKEESRKISKEPSSLAKVLEEIPEGRYAVLRRDGNEFSLVDFYPDEQIAEEAAKKFANSNKDAVFYWATRARFCYVAPDDELVK